MLPLPLCYWQNHHEANTYYWTLLLWPANLFPNQLEKYEKIIDEMGSAIELA